MAVHMPGFVWHLPLQAPQDHWAPGFRGLLGAGDPCGRMRHRTATLGMMPRPRLFANHALVGVLQEHTSRLFPHAPQVTGSFVVSSVSCALSPVACVSRRAECRASRPRGARSETQPLAPPSRHPLFNLSLRKTHYTAVAYEMTSATLMIEFGIGVALHFVSYRRWAREGSPWQELACVAWLVADALVLCVSRRF